MPRDGTTCPGRDRGRHSLEAGLARLEEFDGAELASEWEARHGSAPPPALPTRLLRLALAHELQADDLGALSQKAARQLDRLAAAEGLDRSATGRPARQLAAKPGATLVRDWHGRTHRIEVMADGRFAWRDRSWRSLSAIAREITGTRRNGPAFFGLREGGDGKA